MVKIAIFFCIFMSVLHPVTQDKGPHRYTMRFHLDTRYCTHVRDVDATLFTTEFLFLPNGARCERDGKAYKYIGSDNCMSRFLNKIKSVTSILIILGPCNSNSDVFGLKSSMTLSTLSLLVFKKLFYILRVKISIPSLQLVQGFNETARRYVKGRHWRFACCAKSALFIQLFAITEEAVRFLAFVTVLIIAVTEKIVKRITLVRIKIQKIIRVARESWLLHSFNETWAKRKYSKKYVSTMLLRIADYICQKIFNVLDSLE